jgi:glycosyltransferase involved in cell wall biosynthesis
MAENASRSALLRDLPVYAIPNPIDTSYYFPVQKEKVRQKLNLPPGKKLILFGAGNLNDHRKGLSFFLEALAFCRIGKEEAAIVVFGKNSDIMKSQDHFTVYDFGRIYSTGKMKELYQASDLFVIPSLQDNLPNTIMESMACGTPVVAFKTGGIPEMIDHKKTGYLAEYKSAEDLARGIKWVLENNKDNCLGKAGREKVLREYSEEVVAKQYIKLYESLLNG